MIDVLYILGNGSQCWNLELKYSLRSLEKYCSDVRNVYIAGLCPDFIDKSKVEWIYLDDVACPRFNHWYKVHNTFKILGSKVDYLVLMYDDIFFTQQTNLAGYPYYYSGELDVVNKANKYHLAKGNSRVLLEKLGKQTLDFENHCPIRYNRDKFMMMEDLFKNLKNDDVGLSVRSVYANLFANQYEMAKQSDLKIRTQPTNLEEIIKGRDCFSISADTFYGGVFEWLKLKFPNKSKWEV